MCRFSDKAAVIASVEFLEASGRIDSMPAPMLNRVDKLLAHVFVFWPMVISLAKCYSVIANAHDVHLGTSWKTMVPPSQQGGSDFCVSGERLILWIKCV